MNWETFAAKFIEKLREYDHSQKYSYLSYYLDQESIPIVARCLESANRALTWQPVVVQGEKRDA